MAINNISHPNSSSALNTTTKSAIETLTFSCVISDYCWNVEINDGFFGYWIGKGCGFIIYWFWFVFEVFSEGNWIEMKWLRYQWLVNAGRYINIIIIIALCTAYSLLCCALPTAHQRMPAVKYSQTHPLIVVAHKNINQIYEYYSRTNLVSLKIHFAHNNQPPGLAVYHSKNV